MTAVTPAVVQGERTVRLSIRFERGGLKQIAASAAGLVRADAEPAASGSRPGAEPGLDDRGLLDRLTGLPEGVLDAGRPLAARFEAAVGLYRYERSGRGVLDWAASMTGLADPLSRLPRHELERSFEAFRRELDRVTRTLAMELVRTDPASAAPIVRGAPAEARALLRSLAGGR